MNYFQIIIVCEGETDKLYINELLDKEYPDIFEDGNKRSYIVMRGKTNYSQKSVLANIEKAIKKFEHGETIVVYIIDTDNIHSKNYDKDLLNKIKEFIEKKGYCLIFFNNCIEDVINPNVEKSDKMKKARGFIWNKNEEERNKLRKEDFEIKGSNFIKVFDDIYRNKKMK